MQSKVFEENHRGHPIAREGFTDREVVEEAISLTTNDFKYGRGRNGLPLIFEFNGVIVKIKHNSKPELILRDLRLAIDGSVKKGVVGPYPTP